MAIGARHCRRLLLETISLGAISLLSPRETYLDPHLVQAYFFY